MIGWSLVVALFFLVSLLSCCLADVMQDEEPTDSESRAAPLDTRDADDMHVELQVQVTSQHSFHDY